VRLLVLSSIMLVAAIAFVVSDRATRRDQITAPVKLADFPVCVIIHNGPIQRPDHYNADPHGRKADDT
jgi:hypothetical protein